MVKTIIFFNLFILNFILFLPNITCESKTLDLDPLSGIFTEGDLESESTSEDEDRDEGNGVESRPDKRVCYHLGGIVFRDKKNWTILLNNVTYTADMPIPSLKILDVTPGGIYVKSILPSQGCKEEKEKGKWLLFNQIYCPDSCEIIAGDLLPLAHVKE